MSPVRRRREGEGLRFRRVSGASSERGGRQGEAAEPGQGGVRLRRGGAMASTWVGAGPVGVDPGTVSAKG
jgi:hypothetical protein